jgi:aldehyde:ferredoxin oxidoreductase
MYGLDTISAGDTIAWAMECYEKGILTKDDLGGIELEWGNAEAMVEMLRLMCLGEGAGALLTQGTLRAARQVGKNSLEFAVQVKGLEAALHEPRGKVGVALMYGTSPRGAVHTGYAHDTDFEKANSMPEIGIVETVSRFSFEGKPRLMKMTNDAWIALELLGVCIIVHSPLRSPVRVDMGLEILNAATGWDMGLDEFVQVGERANNMARAFNVRLGIARNADTLPKRFSEPLIDGASAGHAISQADFETMLDEYYTVRGWDANGVPTQSKLDELGIGDVAHQF